MAVERIARYDLRVSPPLRAGEDDEMDVDRMEDGNSLDGETSPACCWVYVRYFTPGGRRTLQQTRRIHLFAGTLAPPPPPAPPPLRPLPYTEGGEEELWERSQS